MDALESLFMGEQSGLDPSILGSSNAQGNNPQVEDDESEEEDLEMDHPSASFSGTSTNQSYAASYHRRDRPERGKFTILDGIPVAHPHEIVDVDFSMDLLQTIFQDPRLGIQFLARYGLIPNSRSCKIETCPRDQLMSLIKHANGYVWRCRSCRKRRERRVITKISVYEGTFLFYSRMPLNKFFIFMYIWCENPGLTIAEYNRLLGEHRLVEETIFNTIGFFRDHIQKWCSKNAVSRIGGAGKHVEVHETLHTEQLSCKHRNRRTRQFSMRYVLICWQDDSIVVTSEFTAQQTQEELQKLIDAYVEPQTTIVMRDILLERFGEQDTLQVSLGVSYTLHTIADEWLSMSEEERDKQFVKTEMNQVPASQDPFAYEYFFRRRFLKKPFNHLLKIIRELYIKPVPGVVANKFLPLP